MTTRKELQEWLNRFPEETIIEIGIQDEPRMYDSYGRVDFVTPKLTDSDFGEGWDLLDFRNSKSTSKDKPWYKKCILRLGESC